MSAEKNKSSGNTVNIGLEELVEEGGRCEDFPPAIVELAEELLSLERALDARTIPTALIAQHLVRLKPALANLALTSDLRQASTKLIERILSPQASFQLSRELRDRLTSVEHSLDHSTYRRADDLPASEIKPQSNLQPQGFSSLVRSLNKREVLQDRELDTNSPVKKRSSSFRLAYVIAIVATLLVTTLTLWFNRSWRRDPQIVSSTERKVFRSLVNAVAQEPLVPPSFDPVEKVASLTSLAYELGERKSVGKESLMSTKQAPHPSSNSQQPQPITIQGRDEPSHVRDLQNHPETTAVENQIDFPPFRNSGHSPKSATEPPIQAAEYSVTSFSTLRYYKAMVATDVMRKPSYYGERIAVLRIGETIAVEAIVGPWVRFAAADGSLRYVLRQDVAELSH